MRFKKKIIIKKFKSHNYENKISKILNRSH